MAAGLKAEGCPALDVRAGLPVALAALFVLVVVAGIRSDACHAIWTLYTFLPSFVLTETVVFEVMGLASRVAVTELMLVA